MSADLLPRPAVDWALIASKPVLRIHAALILGICDPIPMPSPMSERGRRERTPSKGPDQWECQQTPNSSTATTSEAGEVGWHFAEYDEDQYRITLPWYREGDEEDSFFEQAEERLLAEIGHFTETDWQADGYFERKHAAEERIGVTFESYGSYDYGGRILAVYETSVNWGCSGVLDLAALAAQPATEGWDDKLAAAISALGITPKQERPGWLLCAMYG